MKNSNLKNAMIKQDAKNAKYYCKLLVKRAKAGKVIIQKAEEEFYISDGCFIYRFGACQVDAVELLKEKFKLPEENNFSVEVVNDMVGKADFSLKFQYEKMQKTHGEECFYTGFTFTDDKDLSVFKRQNDIVLIRKDYVKPYENTVFWVSDVNTTRFAPIVTHSATHGLVVLPIRFGENSLFYRKLKAIAEIV